MYMLEHGVDDKAKVTAAIPGISQIQELQTAWKDDYSLNKQLRNKFRVRLHASAPSPVSGRVPGIAVRAGQEYFVLKYICT